jgi:dTDP-4-dehydrorhamnose 3,5-epimerase
VIVTPTRLREVLIVEPVVHRDARGFFVETYRLDRYTAAGLPQFVQDNHSRSQKDTLRGLHWQADPFPQAKLVRVLAGEIFDVAVDIRPESPTFGQWVGTTLSADNFRQLFVPVGFAHGFCVVSEVADVEYKCSAPYDPAAERGLAWDDPEVGVDWPTQTPFLSVRDRSHQPLSALRRVVHR